MGFTDLWVNKDVSNKWWLGGGNSNIFWCSPRKLGKMNPFWRIFFRWVGSTTNEVGVWVQYPGPWKINGWKKPEIFNPWNFGTSSEPNHHDFRFKLFIFRGVVEISFLPGTPSVLFFKATLPLKPATIALKIGHLAFQVFFLANFDRKKPPLDRIFLEDRCFPRWWFDLYS